MAYDPVLYKTDINYRRRLHNNKLHSRYGITVEEYDRMFAEQDGKCAICGVKVEKHRLCVDHDHATGKVRGLLCRLCNRHLGGFRDSIDLLRRAIAYLER